MMATSFRLTFSFYFQRRPMATYKHQDPRQQESTSMEPRPALIEIGDQLDGWRVVAYCLEQH
jgi:hypothetical protein